MLKKKVLSVSTLFRLHELNYGNIKAESWHLSTMKTEASTSNLQRLGALKITVRVFFCQESYFADLTNGTKP